jgi:outer membrane lipoprotein-sorting protein
LILDKNFLIKKINILEKSVIDKNLINFTIIENDNEINIFFDNETFNLVGWKTRDIYQNTNITYLSSIETNKEITKNLFKIPNEN